MQETFKSCLPTARTSSTVLEVPFHPEISPFPPGPLEKGALESPRKLEELDRQEEVRILNVHLLVYKWLVLYHVSCRLRVVQERAANCSRHRELEAALHRDVYIITHTYIHTYIRTYIHTYIHTYIRTYCILCLIA